MAVGINGKWLKSINIIVRQKWRLNEGTIIDLITLGNHLYIKDFYK
jgi:hypothetical protein